MLEMFATGKMQGLLPTDVTVGETNISHTQLHKETGINHTIKNDITQEEMLQNFPRVLYSCKPTGIKPTKIIQTSECCSLFKMV
jgi:hypothetical protein